MNELLGQKHPTNRIIFTRKLTCLIIPWLVVFGLTQVAVLASVILCVIYLPGYFKVSQAGASMPLG